MTMIACNINDVAPIVIGDLLISQSIRPSNFKIPVLHEDVLEYLSEPTDLHPVSLDQKLYILKPNVCIAFSGTVGFFKKFLEDISIFCKAKDIVTTKEIAVFLDDYNKDEWSEFSFVLLVAEKEASHFWVGKFLHGQWLKGETEILGEVFSSGSGSLDFLKEVKESIKVLPINAEGINYVLMANILMICKILGKERLTLNTIKKHWGAGFELIYFDGNKFRKLDDITYVVNAGRFDLNGEINDVPVPLAIMNYKYHNELLVITVLKPNKGTTETTDTKYIIISEDFKIEQFIVSPIDYDSSPENMQNLPGPSFVSNRNAMAYIIETESSHYLPVSFNVGPELVVKYKHPHQIMISMNKLFNDTMTAESKASYLNFRYKPT
ncbi:MAG: hypothetical protein QM791_13235 [Ferruginibacter sp.]